MRDVQVIELPGREALARWEQLRSQHASTGFWPVLLGGEESLKFLQECGEVDVAKLLQVASSTEAKSVFDSRFLEHFEGWEDEDGNPIEPDVAMKEVEGTWPAQPVSENLPMAHKDLASARGRFLKKAYIGLVKAEFSFEVFPYVQEGAWNEYPAAEEHVAIHRYWSKQWQSEILSVTNDIIECRVESPPTTREEATALAREHFIYCPDIVEQGTESIAALAAALLNSKYWYFWWD